MRISLGRIRIEQCDLIYPVAVTAGVIIVLAEQQIRRCSRIAGHHIRWHDGRRVVPTETGRRLARLKVSAEMQQESARSIVRITENAEEYIPVRTDHRRG